MAATHILPPHRRRSIRLAGSDYSRAGAYFVTDCVQDRACLFGGVVEGHMPVNAAGEMVQSVWHEIPAVYPGVDVDAFVVMPNHVHGIIDAGRGPPLRIPPTDPKPRGR